MLGPKVIETWRGAHDVGGCALGLVAHPKGLLGGEAEGTLEARPQPWPPHHHVLSLDEGPWRLNRLSSVVRDMMVGGYPPWPALRRPLTFSSPSITFS